MSRLDLMREVHGLIDEAIRHLFEYGRGPDGEKVAPTCRDKCPSCCYEPVYAERTEAALIAQHLLRLPAEQRAGVVQRTRAWLEQFRKSKLIAEESPDVIDYRRERLACPLLEDGSCLVYEDRPWGCRAHIALGARDRCEDSSKRREQTWVANNDFHASAMMKLAGGLARGGRAELLMEHLGLLLAEALTGERVESQARQMLQIEFEDDRVPGEATEGGGVAASSG